MEPAWLRVAADISTVMIAVCALIIAAFCWWSVKVSKQFLNAQGPLVNPSKVIGPRACGFEQPRAIR